MLPKSTWYHFYIQLVIQNNIKKTNVFQHVLKDLNSEPMTF